MKKMKIKMEIKEIYELEYKVNKNKKYIRLLDDNFINRSKSFGYYIYNGNRFKLEKRLETKNVINKDKIKIKMIFMKRIFNKKLMFKDCEELLNFSMPDKTKYSNDSNNNDIYEVESNIFDELSENSSNNFFYEEYEESLLSINFSESEIFENKEDHSKEKDKSTFQYIQKNLNNLTKNHYDLSGMFYNCSSLLSLQGIDNLEESISNITAIFCNCSLLTSLPDISKWNINNATNMNSIFYGCSSLISLPDISKWGTSCVTDMNTIFDGCSSLISLPDISNWNTSNVTKMKSIFYGCSSLISLPDISKWNTNNITDIMGFFMVALL